MIGWQNTLATGDDDGTIKVRAISCDNVLVSMYILAQIVLQHDSDCSRAADMGSPTAAVRHHSLGARGLYLLHAIRSRGEDPPGNEVPHLCIFRICDFRACASCYDVSGS
jgi:hypothetical protein